MTKTSTEILIPKGTKYTAPSYYLVGDGNYVTFYYSLKYHKYYVKSGAQNDFITTLAHATNDNVNSDNAIDYLLKIGYKIIM